MQTDIVTNTSSFTIGSKLRDYMALGKFTLSFMVTFSAVVSYLLVPGIQFSWGNILLLFAGGLLVTFSANAVNQVTEKDSDAKMMRTAKRPVASGRMGVAEGWMFAIVTLAVGLFLLGNFFNLTSAVIALVSWFLYAYMYTPMKKVSSFSVLFGAI